jgi:hypothetical protein
MQQCQLAPSLLPLDPWSSFPAFGDLVGRYSELGFSEFVVYAPEPEQQEAFQVVTGEVMPTLRLDLRGVADERYQCSFGATTVRRFLRRRAIGGWAAPSPSCTGASTVLVVATRSVGLGDGHHAPAVTAGTVHRRWPAYGAS